MLQDESVKFLEYYIKHVNDISPEEIETLRRRYAENMKCDHYCHSCNWDFIKMIGKNKMNLY